MYSQPEYVSASAITTTGIPAFLTKLWSLVSDPGTDNLIRWDKSGFSFHVLNQARFAKEILPQYYKHNNMASFIRQLNMYGFRKVVHVEQGALKSERDDLEFQHQYFVQGEDSLALLQFIKRKATPSSKLSGEGTRVKTADVAPLLNSVKLMQGKQEMMDVKLLSLKKENDSLWREVAILRQKHSKQQQVVNKLIQFLVSLVHSGGRGINVKRNATLAIEEDSCQKPKYARKQYTDQGLKIEELFQDAFTEDLSTVVVGDPEQKSNTPPATLVKASADGNENEGSTVDMEAILESNAPGIIVDAASPGLDDVMLDVGFEVLPADVPADLHHIIAPPTAAKGTPSSSGIVDEQGPIITQPQTPMTTICRTADAGDGCASQSSNDFISEQAEKSSLAVHGSEISEHVDQQQHDLDSLCELLTNGTYSLDAGALFGLDGIFNKPLRTVSMQPDYSDR
ncbi:PREDICTED: heat shock factor protein 1-like, partial [Priapulus caudatus]|uniref:Heat shock factor protein 1-like n=1 Tax=Priapulus caudatus TaxID=37621 RepID=A0ABM1FC61_PRICU